MKSRYNDVNAVFRLQPGRMSACLLACAVLVSRAHGQTTAPAAEITAPKLSLDSPDHRPSSTDDVYNMSLEDLMNVQVSSVSKMLQSISQAPAAVTVIDQDQIQRSGMTSIAELLRLVPGMDVARVNATTTAVGARGFNGSLSNKLLVLMDGRTAYDPLWAGTFWGMQDYVLADIERIEVIRGSGATLWGSNAVNGVINITTKSARDTQGFRFDAIAGTLDSSASLRYGGQLDATTFYRVYGKFSNTNSFPTGNGGHFNDGWQGSRGGFRIDRYPDTDTTLTLQGDILYNHLTDTDAPGSSIQSPAATGGNIIGRWTHNTSSDSGFSLQLYYDQTGRDDPIGDYHHRTFDVDFQQHFPVGSFQMLNWGLGTRLEYASIPPGRSAVLPGGLQNDYTANTFIQDDITLVPKRLHVIVGSKFQFSSYDQFQVQPSARLLFTPDERNTFWLAASRAVRSPSLVETEVKTDLTALGQPGLIDVGNPALKPEILKSVEFGYRCQPTPKLTLDLATFYNQYDQLTGLTFQPPNHLTTVNGARGQSVGAEFSADYKVSSSWRLAASYTALFADTNAASHVDLSSSNDAGSSSKHQFQFHSYYDLTRHLEFNASTYYMGGTNETSQYVRLDLGINWKLAKGLELGITGQNLLQREHLEIGGQNRAEPVPRSAFIHLSYSF